MAYIIAEPCIGIKDTACVDACPVDCIHPRKDEGDFNEATQLYASIAGHVSPFVPSLQFSLWTIFLRSGPNTRKSTPIISPARQNRHAHFYCCFREHFANSIGLL